MDAGLNWLWQGCVVALVSFVTLRLLERARANVRYVVCWAALLLIVVLPALPSLGTDATRPDSLSSTADAVLSVPDVWWTSSAVMLAAWTVWASAYVVRFMWAMVALCRARARSRPFPSQAETTLCHWRRMRSGGRRAALVLSDSVPTAAVLGCGAPLIAVSPSLLARLDADELDRVLIHEWAHVQRRDDLVTILQIVIRIVAGWHPAVWWIERRLHIEREIACDEVTIAVTGSPKSYAECLVKLASLRGAEPILLPGPAVLTASGLRSRVRRIVARHAFIAPFWSRGIATAVVSALCAVSLGVGGLKLVEMTAFALPFESIRVADASIAGIAPVAVSSPASDFGPSLLSPRRTVASVPSARRPAADGPAPARLATPDPEAHVALEAPSQVAAAVPQATARDDEVATALEPVTAQSDVPPAQAPAPTVEESRSPWAAAADGGTALGRKSKEAGVATAGFFTRFARRVAGSF